jgi:hypothetical protein
MLIDHDFDWEPDLEEPPRALVDQAPGQGPDPPTRRPGGQIRPSEQVVIIERRRGFSRSTLILALVALTLSAASTQSCRYFLPAAGERNPRSTVSFGSVETGPSRHSQRIISGMIAPPNF